MRTTPTATNRVVIEMDAHIPEDKRGPLYRWINLQHAGSELIPLDAKTTKEHRDAAHAMCRCRRYSAEFKIDKQSDLKFVKFV